MESSPATAARPPTGAPGPQPGVQRGPHRALLVTRVTCMEVEGEKIHCTKLYVFVRMRHRVTGAA